MANSTIALACSESAQNDAQYRIDTIPLFGSQKLTRDCDGNTWIFSSGTTKPKRLTMRESMFINASLRARRTK